MSDTRTVSWRVPEGITTWVAPDPVNQPMIRHYMEAVGDENPVYQDEEAARAVGLPGVVAPPAMLQAWLMRGLKATLELERERDSGSSGAQSPQDEVFAALDAAGFTSVVATNCEQEYFRPLVLGDRLSGTSRVESISEEKATALGPGHFVTTLTEIRDEAGEQVATMRFRVLKFRPKENAPESGAEEKHGEASTTGGRVGLGRRPRPAITRDNAFFFEAAREHRLVAQRCSSCGELRHPPQPGCPSCRSLDWEEQEVSGSGTVYSFVVVHHPKVPGFDYPLVVALVELEEGLRIVANIDGAPPEAVRIGMPVCVGFLDDGGDLSIPVFHPEEAVLAGVRGSH